RQRSASRNSSFARHWRTPKYPATPSRSRATTATSARRVTPTRAGTGCEAGLRMRPFVRSAGLPQVSGGERGAAGPGVVVGQRLVGWLVVRVDAEDSLQPAQPLGRLAGADEQHADLAAQVGVGRPGLELTSELPHPRQQPFEPL